MSELKPGKGPQCPLCDDYPGVEDGRWKVHERWLPGEWRSRYDRCPNSNKPVKR